ncbi:MAG: DUF1573 domain-containing protein, partial [Planctomycetaceae bacterium]|nr:DUF1573 domain-containing protein [Planctomycetaceae bacterium]
GAILFARESTTAPLIVTKSRPALLFSTYLHHHGEDPVPAGAVVDSRFLFRNEGTSPVEIQQIERSCGCLSPRLSHRELQPGEQGELLVPLSTVNQAPGPGEFTLTVHYTDPQPRQTTLTIKAVFPKEMVVVRPRALYLSQKSDREIPFDISVTDFRPQNLSVDRVESSSSFVRAQLQAAEPPGIVQTGFSDTPEPPSEEPFDSESSVVSASGTTLDNLPQNAGHRFHVAGTVAANIPPGRHDVVVAVTTTDPEFRVLTVPMILNGPERPDDAQVLCQPPLLRLFVRRSAALKPETEAAVDVPAHWNISGADAWPEALSVRYEEQPPVEGRRRVQVRVRMDQRPDAKISDGVVQLVANDGRDLVTLKLNLLWE